MHLYLALVLLGLINLCRSSSSGGPAWDYNSPQFWASNYPQCAGDTESPIDIIVALTNFSSFTPFVFSQGYDEPQIFTLTNNGHSIQAVQKDPNVAPLQLTGGGLDGVYDFVNFHLHWGDNDAAGSEHLLNGQSYSGEIHLVHQNTVTNQIAVLGMFLQSSMIPANFPESEITKDWKTFFKNAEKLSKESDTNEIFISLSSFMTTSSSSINSTDFTRFWRYDGSLTTPPCSPNVTWTVFEVPIWVDAIGFHNFRPSIIPKNDRPTQAVNGRNISQSFN